MTIIRHRFENKKQIAEEGSDAIGAECTKCKKKIAAGDAVTLVLGQRKEIARGIAVAAAALLHYDCAGYPADQLVSSVAIEEGGHHDVVSIWNRGGLAGSVVVKGGDGQAIADRLLSDPLPANLEPTEPPPPPSEEWKELMLAAYAYSAVPQRPVAPEDVARYRSEIAKLTPEMGLDAMTYRVGTWANAVFATTTMAKELDESPLRGDEKNRAERHAAIERGREAMRKAVVAWLAVHSAIAKARS